MTVHFWGSMCAGAGDLCFVGMIKKGKFFIVNHHRGEKEARLVISINQSAKHIVVISGTKINCREEIMDTKLLQRSKETCVDNFREDLSSSSGDSSSLQTHFFHILERVFTQRGISNNKNII